MSKEMKRISSLVIVTIMTVISLLSGMSFEVQAKTVDYSAVFNATYYANKYADVKAAYGTNAQQLLNHFVNYGMAEGRQGSEEFNVQAYKARYTDLQAIYGDDLKSYYLHYINYGKAEGRDGRATTNSSAQASTTVVTTSTAAASQTTTVTSTQNQSVNNEGCYIAASGNGKRYHCKPNCSGMNGVIETTVSEASMNGYTACGRCYR